MRCVFFLAEMVGFEPTCPSLDKTISSRSRYDHFDTSPYKNPKDSLDRTNHMMSPLTMKLFQYNRFFFLFQVPTAKKAE